MVFNMLSDEALYERFLRGDLDAFDLLYERYERLLFGFVRRHISDNHEAEDVLHDVFLALLREKKAGRTAASFKAWMFQVARNLCLNRLRTRTRGCMAINTEQHADRPANDIGTHPEHVLQERETAHALRQSVSNLPTALAELYQLRAGGMSYQELAQVFEVPLGTIKSRMHEMVSRLREEMQRCNAR